MGQIQKFSGNDIFGPAKVREKNHLGPYPECVYSTYLKNVIISHCPIVKTITVLYKRRTNNHFNTNLLFNRWNKVRKWAIYYTRQFSNFTIFLEKKKNNNNNNKNNTI